jgi:hypothetical protein
MNNILNSKNHITIMNRILLVSMNSKKKEIISLEKIESIKTRKGMKKNSKLFLQFFSLKFL